MTKQEMLTVVSDHIELGTPIKVVKNGNDNYSVYAECSDGLVKLSMKKNENFEMNREWFLNFDTVMGESYTIYFTKNGNDWVFGLYLKNGGCIGEKKCHKWYEPDNFVYFAEKCILHPDDSNVDCSYLD